jgi:enoyl-CoA hydratase/carnithine racemase
VADEDVEFAVRDGVAVVTLNRPAQRNAFSGRMGVEIGRAYARCDADDDVRAVVLTGAGRDFCVGADFSDRADLFQTAAASGDAFSAAAVDPPAFAIRKPVIAAVNGHAVGIGLTLPMQCDIRIFAREGRYGFLHVRRGVLPDAYSHWTVPRAIGFARTAELFLTGRHLTGDEALAYGLASRVCPAAEVLPTALGIARDIAVHAAPLSVALCKRLLWEGRSLGPEEVERMETALHRVVMTKPDALEGVTAFLERRTPDWQQRVARDWPDPWPGRR